VRSSVLFVLLVVAAFISVHTAIADNQPQSIEAKHEKPQKQRPLQLPDINAEVRGLQNVERDDLHARVRLSQSSLRFWGHRGKWLRATRHAKCYEVAWQRSCTLARANYHLQRALLKAALRRLKYELPITNDWVTAVRIAQRVYPGTAARLLVISDQEGGRGSWVWFGGRPWQGHHIGNDYLGADTVGGWLQYRYSTFIGHWHAAVKDLKQRGYIIPDLGWARPRVRFGVGTGYGPWLSPLGQTLAAGWAHYYGKQACHWCL